jgi:hypothetical protein
MLVSARAPFMPTFLKGELLEKSSSVDNDWFGTIEFLVVFDCLIRPFTYGE